MNNTNNNVFARLHDISNQPGSEKDRYEEMLKFLHLKTNDKDIEFSKELQKKFDIEYKIIKFDQGYFENAYYSPLYVYFAAFADSEVYSWLKEAYDMTHDEALSYEILESEIQIFKKKHGPFLMWCYDLTDDKDKALMYEKRTFLTNMGKPYDIDYVFYRNRVRNGKIELKFVIEYADFEFFKVVLKYDEAFKKAMKFPEPKRFDQLYLLAEHKLKDRVSEVIDD